MSGVPHTANGVQRLHHYVWGLAGIWTIVFAASMTWNWIQQETEALEAARIQARSAFERDVIYRRWNAEHGGVYAPVTPETPPNPYLNEDERDILTPSGRMLTLINPAYMTRQVYEMSLQYGVIAHITSLNPIRPGNEPDPWETSALESFEHGSLEESTIERMGGEEYLRFMRPFFTEESCLPCHAEQGYNVGDVRGGLSVSIPLEPFRAVVRPHLVILSASHFALWAMGIVGLFFGARRIEETIRERERSFEAQARLAAIVESSEDAIIGKTLDGTIVSWNNGAERMYGYSAEEAVGQSVRIIVPPDHRDEVPQILDRISRGEHVDRYETVRVRKDGERLHVAVAISPIKDSAGRIIGASTIARDITGKKRTEEELRRFRLALDVSRDNVFLIDPIQMRFVDANRTAFSDLEFTREELLSMGPQDIKPYHTHERLQEEFEEVIRKNITGVIETVHRRKDGSEFPVEVFLRTLKSENRDLIVAVARDITERKHAEQERLQYSQRLEEKVEERTRELRETQEQLIRKERLAVLGQLAGGVGHELRNPLGVISNAVYFLKMTLPEAGESINEYLGIITAEIANAERIVSDLMDLSRTRTRERHPQSVSMLIDQVIDKLPPPEGITLNLAIPSDLPPVFVDSGSMGQVLFNLITNAYQAMTDGGQLAIEASYENENVRIAISDSGCGISQENLKKVFEPLYTTKSKGIGLGLAVTKNLVQSNGGRIEVVSRKGEGSTFTLILPASE